MFKNTMKTGVLLASLGGLIVAVATLLGGRGGATIGLVLAFVMVGGSYWFSDKLALRPARAQGITEADSPEFYRPGPRPKQGRRRRPPGVAGR